MKETLNKTRVIWAGSKSYQVDNFAELVKLADAKMSEKQSEIDAIKENEGCDLDREQELNEELDNYLLQLVYELMLGKYISVDDLRTEVRIADHDASYSRQGDNQLSYVISSRKSNKGKGSDNVYFTGVYHYPSDVVSKILTDVDSMLSMLPMEAN